MIDHFDKRAHIVVQDLVGWQACCFCTKRLPGKVQHILANSFGFNVELVSTKLIVQLLKHARNMHV